VSTLAVAIERKQWELVSLCLLVGVVEAAAALPPDAVEGLLEVLAGLEDEEARPRGGVRSPSTGPSTALSEQSIGVRRADRTGRGRRR
jgi:hypothetical protein